LASLLLSLLLTSGCSGVGKLVKDAVLPDGGGVDVTANVGKVETEKGNAQQGETNVAIAPVEENVYTAPIETVVNESGLSWWEFLAVVLLAGWAIPSPGEMLRGIVTAFRNPLGRRRRRR